MEQGDSVPGVVVLPGRQRSRLPRSRLGATLVHKLLPGFGKYGQVWARNHSVSFLVVYHDGKAVILFVCEHLTAEKRASIGSPKDLHNGGRDVELARHALNPLGHEVPWSEEEYRNAVLIDGNEVASANMHPVVAQKNE